VICGRSNLGSAVFFGGVLTLAACALDPVVKWPYLTPKEYALYLASAGALLFWAVRIRTGASGSLRITGLEAILTANLIWPVLVNPHWIVQREGNWFWPLLAGLVLTIVVRQLFNPEEPAARPSSGPGPRAIALTDFMLALSLVGSLLAIHGLAGALAAGGFQPEDGSVKTTLVSLIGIENGFGAFMATGAIAALTSAFVARRKLLRWFLAGAAVLQLTALLGNGSRGALLGLFTGGVLVIVLSRRGAKRSGRQTVALGVVALVAVSLAGLLLYRVNPGSGRARLIGWEISGAMLADHPLTGVGTGRFGLEFGRYQAQLWRDPGRAEFDRQAAARRHPNSELVHQFAEQGIPGGALYALVWVSALGFLLRALSRSNRTSAHEWGLFALLVAILVHSLVDNALHWIPTLVTAHLAFGLIPAPVLVRVDLSRRWARQLALVTAVGWTATVVTKTAREYPGYQLWEKADSREPGERLELLKRAQQRLPWEPYLNEMLGSGLLDVGQPQQAVSVLQTGIEELDGINFRLALAEAQLEVGWLGPAELNARTLAARYPDRLLPRLLLARIHHTKGEDAQARVYLGSCIQRDTHIRSSSVDSVVAQAEALWRIWYDDEPPR